jgi:hypothetical protein
VDDAAGAAARAVLDAAKTVKRANVPSAREDEDIFSQTSHEEHLQGAFHRGIRHIPADRRTLRVTRDAIAESTARLARRRRRLRVNYTLSGGEHA